MADQSTRAGAGPSSADEIIGLASQQQQELSAKRAEPPRPPVRPRITRWAFVLTLPILPIVLVANFTGFSVTTLLEPTPPPVVARGQAEQILKDLVAEVELFRKDYDELPGTLLEVGLPERGEWHYSVFGSGQFKIQGALFQQHVSFESSPVAPASPPAQEDAVKP